LSTIFEPIIEEREISPTKKAIDIPTNVGINRIEIDIFYAMEEAYGGSDLLKSEDDQLSVLDEATREFFLEETGEELDAFGAHIHLPFSYLLLQHFVHKYVKSENG